MFAKRFFYVCAGLLCLAIAYHLGAERASAQAPGNPVVAAAWAGGPGDFFVVTAAGDCYGTTSYGQYGWFRVPNVFDAPTAETRSTWGQLKARYRDPVPPRTDR